jgi:hypothetical protein
MLIADRKAVDRRLTAELPIDRQHDDLDFTQPERRAWLAERLARASVKTAALDLAAATTPLQLTIAKARDRRREELSHEL